MKYLAILLFFHLSVKSQVTAIPEEIAFRHFCKLVQTDTTYSKLNLLASGEITNYTFSNLDTIFCKVRFIDSLARNPFGQDCKVSEQRRNRFKLPLEYKPDKTRSLRIYKYLKVEGFFYVLMNFSETDFSGYNLTLILNQQGDLVAKCLTKWIE